MIPSMDSPTREQFIEQVLQHVKQKFPLVKVARGEAPFSVKINGHLATLENLYRVSCLQPDDSLHHIERWMVELLRAAEGGPDRNAPFDEIKERILPLILPSEKSETYESAVTQPLLEGLVVGYAIDSDRTIAYLSKTQFDTWRMTLDDLHETALQNMVARSEAISAHAAEDEDGKINLILFQTMDGYDASRILLPTLHERLREYLGSPFAAGIPNRDILLCFRNDDETVARMRAQISDDYRSMPHQVTERILLITPDGIAPRVGSP
jgi:hypothetical protein